MSVLTTRALMIFISKYFSNDYEPPYPATIDHQVFLEFVRDDVLDLDKALEPR